MSKNSRYYFAYGSNLSADKLRKLGISPDALRKVGNAYLPDQELVFSRESKNWNGGALGLRRRRGQLVEGVMFEVTDEGWTALDRAEGVHVGAYEPVYCIALTPDGAEHSVTAYNVCEDQQQSHVPPSVEYLETVRDGYAQHDINDAMLMAVSRNEIPKLALDALFVYGTLMRGECRFHTLQDAGLECVLLAETYGRLFDRGSYPAMVVSPDDSTTIQGEFIRLSDPENTLKQLDAIEGFGGYVAADSLYRRALIEVHVGDGRIRRAWTYRMSPESSGGQPIESGDWREHHHRRDSFLKSLAAGHAQGDEPGLIARFAKRPPLSFEPNPAVAVAGISSLWEALASKIISERMLAQESRRWVIVP